MKKLLNAVPKGMHHVNVHVDYLSFPLASPFPIMDYIPNLSFVNNPKPALLLGAEALSPVIVKRLEYVLLCISLEVFHDIIVTHVLNLIFICWQYICALKKGALIDMQCFGRSDLHFTRL